VHGNRGKIIVGSRYPAMLEGIEALVFAVKIRILF
jgi:hypothetical protein